MNVIFEETSYTHARNHLAELMDKASRLQNPVFTEKNGTGKQGGRIRLARLK